MTVYAVCQHQDNIEQVVRDFGPVKYINHRYIYPDEFIDAGPAPDGRVSYDLPHEFRRNLAHAAQEFDFNTDYLLLVGDHLQITAFAAMLAQRASQRFRVLRYDRKAEGHISVWV